MSPEPLASVEPGVESQAVPLRAQMAFCSIVAFVFGVIFTYAGGIGPDGTAGTLLTLVLMALVCASLLSVPANSPLRAILLDCLLLQIALMLGTVVLLVGRNFDYSIFLILSSSLFYSILCWSSAASRGHRC